MVQVASSPETWDSDSNYLTVQSMKTYFALGTVVGLPLYSVYHLRKRNKSLSIQELLNSSSLAGVGAATAGGLVEFSRNSLSDAATLKKRRLLLSTSVSRRRQDDFATIGAVLGVCVVPAVFWTRASLVYLTTGGLTWGYGSGFMVHHLKRMSNNPASV
ncbi:hypothetical protein MIND_01064800 [Mycena indigotica]|uniref:Uncharacterized protein n=1 Tax=Mycena indigotica TaxID=2126181 RepID=A0A8H6S9E7_9AGAR|nr:uncharacterized protein MIND_01064800 [Mycena indigotica]KAF7295258.1 hypothetical protein MIND_01064800 [Mycena indigotica]